MTVFVGGTIGYPPTIVSTSIEHALRQTASVHVVPTGDCAECDVVWMCAFVDGEPSQLRWTAQAPDDGQQLYVEMMTIETPAENP